MIGRSTLGKQQNTHSGLLGNTPVKRQTKALISIGVWSVCVFFLARMIESCAAILSSTGMDDALNGPVLDFPGELQSYCHFPSVLHSSNRIVPDFFSRLQKCVHWDGFVQQGLDHSTDSVAIEGNKGILDQI